MFFAVAEPLWAQPTLIDAVPDALPDVLQFKLRAGAVLRRANTLASDAQIRFVGEGKAEATPCGVNIRFGVLDAQGRRGEAVIHVDNPLSYSDRPSFAGHAKCRVRLPNAQFEFALAIRGTIRRTGPHHLTMIGGFRSIRSSVDGAVFIGRFGGPNV